MAQSIVWRKSVYDNNFKCTKCGNTLTDREGWPVYTQVNSLDNPSRLFCNNCGYDVAKINNIPDNLVKDYVNPFSGELKVMGNFEKFCEDLGKKSIKVEKKDKELSKKLEEIRKIEYELARMTQLYNSSKKRCATLEQQSIQAEEKHRKEIAKKDAEINRLYKIIEDINK